MTMQEIKDLMDELQMARMAVRDMEWQAAKAIAKNEVLSEAIDAGLVKPCIPMAQYNMARNNIR